MHGDSCHSPVITMHASRKTAGRVLWESMAAQQLSTVQSVMGVRLFTRQCLLLQEKAEVGVRRACNRPYPGIKSSPPRPRRTGTRTWRHLHNSSRAARRPERGERAEHEQEQEHEQALLLLASTTTPSNTPHRQHRLPALPARLSERRVVT